jgi:hypothetical protein
MEERNRGREEGREKRGNVIILWMPKDVNLPINEMPTFIETPLFFLLDK